MVVGACWNIFFNSILCDKAYPLGIWYTCSRFILESIVNSAWLLEVCVGKLLFCFKNGRWLNEVKFWYSMGNSSLYALSFGDIDVLHGGFCVRNFRCVRREQSLNCRLKKLHEVGIIGNVCLVISR